MKKPVSILVTWDVDPFPDVLIGDKKEALRRTRQLLRDHRIQSTFFLPAAMAEALGNEIQELIQDGHEIGCHGLTHSDEEDYNRMPAGLQRTYLVEATKILREGTGQPLYSFRGPRMKTSHLTQSVLEELGYVADCSVASQRVDFLSSNLVNVNWILAPRLPYRPSHRSAFRKGQRAIWVVPLSAYILPFVSSALYVFRRTIVWWLFRILYREASRTGKPIVYLIHPFEFAPSTLRYKPENLSLLQEIRIHGFLARERFYEKNHVERFKMNQELIRYMKSFPRVKFETVRDYVSGGLMSGRNLLTGDDTEWVER